MQLTNKLKKAIAKILKINETDNMSITINRIYTYQKNAAKNKIWYNGDSYELEQLYKQIPNTNYNFWGSTPSYGLEIRKIHTGLPELMVDTLANITLSDLKDVDFEDDKYKEIWEQICKENNYKRLLEKALKNVLVVGDGAFKISYSANISTNPIIEFYSGEDVDYTYKFGRLYEIKFYNRYNEHGVDYTLEETYGKGYITYKLFKDNIEIPINDDEYQNIVFDPVYKDTILAVPFVIYNSETYDGRGKSIFDGKIDNFDALDEVTSQWLDAIRSSRSRTYIPDTLIPRGASSGELLKPNPFDNKFIKIASDMSENSSNKIDVEQNQVQIDAYIQSYCTYLDLCLQGLISPSTLGIDVKKLDNAESQREKEKTTLYTRQNIIISFSEVLKNLVQITFDSYNMQLGKKIEEIQTNVTFGEYANPSFEALIETMSNPNTPMSIESKIEEIWGDTRSEEWKKEETMRIKEQQGIATLDEPSMLQDLDTEE